MTINFNESDLLKAENEFSLVKYLPEQRPIMNAVRDLLCNFIPISPLAMGGFIQKAFQKWQLNHKMDISSVATMDPEDKILVVSQLVQYLKLSLSRIMLHPEQKPILDEALSNALKFYKDNFAYR